MFADVPTFSSFSVDDLARAEEFYGRTLGLDVSEVPEMDGILQIQLGGGSGQVMVYRKDDHVPATFTILNFVVRDVGTAVDELGGRGVRFEQYTGDIATDERGIHREQGQAIAWFTDPAGNVLSLVEDRAS